MFSSVKNQIEPGFGGKNGFCPNLVFETMIFIKPLGPLMGPPLLAKKNEITLVIGYIFSVNDFT